MTSKLDHPYGYCPGCNSHPAAHLHVERTDDLDELRTENERLRAAITEALGGADCLPDHNMAEYCGWCMLREVLER